MHRASRHLVATAFLIAGLLGVTAGAAGQVTTPAVGPVLNAEISVANPGTGALEAMIPIQTVTGSSKTFATADLFKQTRRSNSGSAMTDTLPASSATGMASGAQIHITNADVPVPSATNTDTVTAGSGTTIEGNSTYVIPAGRDIALVYDLANKEWRIADNTGTAIVLNSQQTQRFAGAKTPSYQSVFNLGYYPNVIYFDDNSTIVGNDGFLNDMVVYDTLWSGTTGGRQVVSVGLDIEGTPAGAATNRNYVAFQPNMFANANLGGTASAPRGAAFAENPVCVLGSRGTYLLENTCAEADFGIETGGSAAYSYGFTIVEATNDAVQGSVGDGGLEFSAAVGGVGKDVGVDFTNFNGQYLLKPTGTALKVRGGTIGYGIDLSAATIGMAAFKSPGFVVDGSGHATVAQLSATGAVTLTGLSTGTNADTLCLSSGGAVLIQAGACTISSKRFKQNITPWSDSDAMADVMKLDPVTFQMKEARGNLDPNAAALQRGLIAEDVAAVDPKLGIFEDDMTTPKSYRQEGVIAALVGALKEQQAEIIAIKRQQTRQQTEILALERRVARLRRK